MASLAPEKPLKSLSFSGGDPTACNGYNTFVAGPSKLVGELPAHIGLVATTSADEIYAYFLQRRNLHLLAEAGKLLSQMLADAGKKLTPLVCAGSTKEAACAYKNALMKKVFVHESMGKFIKKVREDAHPNPNPNPIPTLTLTPTPIPTRRRQEARRDRHPGRPQDLAEHGHRHLPLQDDVRTLPLT